MVTLRIPQDYMLSIPEEFRRVLAAGAEVTLSTDAQGRVVITPIEQVRARLLETFGMWADRTDIPTNGVDYVDELRHGQRLAEFEQARHEAH